MEKKVYTKEFKEEAVKLVNEQGLGVKQAAAELGVSYSAMRKWLQGKKTKGAGAFPGSGKLSPEDQKIRDLEKKVRLLEMERDILKKATAFFAKESL
jgi:transposase